MSYKSVDENTIDCDDDKQWREECGVFGIWNDSEASHLSYLGLYSQQHRGQESAGIVSLDDDGKHIHHKGLGLVGDIFQKEDLDRLRGRAAIGHVRYSTTGENQLTNAQPLTAQLLNGPIAFAHNGNIVNSHVLRKKLIEKGAIFQGTNDSECILHLLARNEKSELIPCLVDCMKELDGAFSIVLLWKGGMAAVRDHRGFRPLVLGYRKNAEAENAFVVASESCAFDLIGAQYIREINPGEIFWVDDEGEHSVQYKEPEERKAQCVFEHVYFSRPDSFVFNQSVYAARKEMGKMLAREHAVEADLVIPVPDSGVPAALGYSEESEIPFELGIIRNHYIGRTFIQPQQSIRDFGVKIKHNPQSAIIKGKRVVVVDDSVVRGTTSKKLINLIRQAGAKEVHLRIASPPTTGPCYYGVDTPRRQQLIASSQSVEQIREFVGADSLGYLTVDGLLKSVKGDQNNYCAACFDGKYPTELYDLQKD